MTQDIFLVIDSGTTNSRVWIIRNDVIIKKSHVHVGAKDTAIAGNVDKLKEGLKEAVSEALRNTNIELKEIRLAVACGMITSNLGLIDLSHLIAPVNIEQVAAKAKLTEISDFLPFPILFIPGVKNNVRNLTIDNIEKADFMRGEETQVFGLLDLLNLSGPVSVIILSSHTKVISINRRREIAGSVTTLSGQIFSVITKDTFLTDSLPKESNFPIEEKMDKRAIVAGYKYVTQIGFLRSLLLIRFMDVLINTSTQERILFLEGIIAGSDIYSIKKSMNFLPIDTNNQIVLVGDKARCQIYSYLLSQDQQIRGKRLIVDEQMAEKATIVGAIKIAKAWILNSSK